MVQAILEVSLLATLLMIMKNPREILNEYKLKKDYEIEDLEIWYVHRGAPNDTKIITGKDIIKIEKTFMKTNTAMIPYHRIFKIIYKEKTVFKR